jgi:hypothetical protein
MFDWVEAIRELYWINKQCLREYNPEVALENQSGVLVRHHQALIAALWAMEQRRDEALRPAPKRAACVSTRRAGQSEDPLERTDRLC